MHDVSTQYLLNSYPWRVITIAKFLSKSYSVLRWYLLFRLGEEWKEPIHGDALLESRELIADESDEEDEEEPVKSRVTETRNKETDKESSGIYFKPLFELIYVLK